MAYNFVAASSQYLNTASTPVTAVPLTFSARFQTTANNNFGTFFVIGRTGSGNTDRFLMRLAGNQVFPTSVLFQALASGTAGNLNTAVSVNADTWYQATAVGVATNQRRLWLNATQSGPQTTNLTPASLNTIAIGSQSDTATAFFDGLLAELAIWNTNLTDAEATSLARGFKPPRIRPQSLQFYAPLVRDLNDLRGALAITNNNAATVADHPRVY